MISTRPVTTELDVTSKHSNGAAITPDGNLLRELQASRQTEALLRDFIETSTISLHWVGPDGTLTDAGRAAHAAVEAATDVAASRPWARVGPQFTADAIKVLTPLAQACASILPSRSPSGVPAPGTT